MSVFTDYYKWLFDGDIKTPIPVDVLKAYVLSNQYLISTFMACGRLNLYLNEYFNNINVFALNKEELLIFIKKCVIDFNIKRSSILYIPFSKKDKNFEIIQSKFPELKSFEISLLIKILETHPERDDFYIVLGLEDDRKPMILKAARREKDEDRSISKYLKRTFKTKTVSVTE